MKKILGQLIQSLKNRKWQLVELAFRVRPISKIYSKSQAARKSVYVSWHLNNQCQFKCDYCAPMLNEGSLKEQSFDDMEWFVRELEKIGTGGQCEFNFLGGEASLSPSFPKLLRLISRMDSRVSVTSNGGVTVDFWRENLKYIDHVDLSYHHEQVNFEHFKQVCEEIENQNVTLNILCMSPPHHLEEISEKMWELRKTVSSPVLVQKIKQSFYSYTIPFSCDYSTDHDETISKFPKNSPFKLSRGNRIPFYISNGLVRTLIGPYMLQTKGLNNFKGWKCKIGQRDFAVRASGEIYSSNCYHSTVIGNIRERELTPLSEPVTCIFDECPCGPDIAIEKSK